MKHCKHCNIDTHTTQNYCPLCFNDLDEVEGKTQQTQLYLTAVKKDKTIKTKYFLYRLFLFLTISAIVICGFINFVTYEKSGSLWSMIVAVSLVYVWIFIAHLILSSRSIFEKILFQLIGIAAILITTNVVAGGNWLLNYVVPAVALTASIVMVMITLISKDRNNYVSTFFAIHILLLVLSLVLVLAKFDDFKLINQINAIFCGLAIFGTLVFGFKTLKSDISKKFHL